MPAAETASKTVTVACKLPHGLILRLFNMVEGQEPVLGGGTRVVKIAQVRDDAESIMLKGYAAPAGMSPKAQVEGGFALTHNVPADFFEEWLKQNRDLDAVKKGLVFAFGKVEDAAARATEHRSLQNGLEALDPEHPQRVGVRNIQKADVRK